MDAQTQKDIFNRFSQADNSTARQYGGSGLGLAISSQLVHLMGGQLAVESQLNKGSSFEFSLTFPLAETEVFPSQKLSTQPHAPLDLYILVVEDNKANQVLVGRQLKTLGCRYKLADNGEEALEILNSEAGIQLVLMDNMMPIMDGERATKIIREWANMDTASPTQKAAAQLPIIMFTANKVDAPQFKKDYPFMTDWVVKPLKISELRKVLEKYRIYKA